MTRWIAIKTDYSLKNRCVYVGDDGLLYAHGVEGPIARPADDGDVQTLTINEPTCVPVVCCARFSKVLADNIVLAHYRFPGEDMEVLMISDGGHGGSESIDYCPFCGRKITFETAPLDR